MNVTDEMVAKALEAAPDMAIGAIRQILEAALSGQIVMTQGAGQTLAEGKSLYPDYMQIEISDTYMALDIARQLVTTVQQQPAANTLERPAIILVSGSADMSYDN